MSQALKVPVSIAIGPDQLARLDQAAADLDRSRSWVACRAIEAFISPLLQRCEPLAAVAEPPPTGRVILPGSADRLGSTAGPVVAHHLAGAGGGRANAGAHYTTAMERQLSRDLEDTERQRQTQDQVAQQNREYLENMGKV